VAACLAMLRMRNLPGMHAIGALHRRWGWVPVWWRARCARRRPRLSLPLLVFLFLPSLPLSYVCRQTRTSKPASRTMSWRCSRAGRARCVSCSLSSFLPSFPPVCSTSRESKFPFWELPCAPRTHALMWGGVGREYDALCCSCARVRRGGRCMALREAGACGSARALRKRQRVAG
jgi:hypothetical protein